MTGQGITQILIYAIVLTALAYPLGLYMARIFESRRVRKTERWFYRLVRTSPDREQDWKGYAKSVLVFSIVASAVRTCDLSEVAAVLRREPFASVLLRGHPSSHIPRRAGRPRRLFRLDETSVRRRRCLEDSVRRRRDEQLPAAGLCPGCRA